MVMLYSMLDWTKLEFYMQFWAAVITKKNKREKEREIIGESSGERQRNNKRFGKEDIWEKAGHVHSTAKEDWKGI